MILLIFVSVMIMFIAWINFINLMVAQNAERGHEFGIVKDHHHLGIKNAIKPMIYFHRYAYDFLDDFYKQQYKPEFRLRKSIAFFAVIAMVLACVGLFSLLKFPLPDQHQCLDLCDFKRAYSYGKRCDPGLAYLQVSNPESFGRTEG